VHFFCSNNNSEHEEITPAARRKPHTHLVALQRFLFLQVLQTEFTYVQSVLLAVLFRVRRVVPRVHLIPADLNALDVLDLHIRRAAACSRDISLLPKQSPYFRDFFVLLFKSSHCGVHFVWVVIAMLPLLASCYSPPRLVENNKVNNIKHYNIERQPQAPCARESSQQATRANRVPRQRRRACRCHRQRPPSHLGLFAHFVRH
jgi:hypothetical protein